MIIKTQEMSDKPGYKKAYMANLQARIKIDKKILAANKGPINPSTLQYIKNGGVVTGVSTFDLAKYDLTK